MFYEFCTMAKEMGHRGWRLDEDDDQFYLSKFDERYNEDEFRFYVKCINHKLHIVHKEKWKGSETPMTIQENNRYYKVAKKLCLAFGERYPELLNGIGYGA